MPAKKPAFIILAENYFRFSRSQRRAMACMVLCTVLLMFLFSRSGRTGATGGQEPFIASEVAAMLVVKDTGYTPYPPGAFDVAPKYPAGNFRRQEEAEPAGHLFYFDPNTATAEQWLELGLREKTVQSILNYRSKGGRFRQPEDLAKIYTLKPEEAQRLIPYVQIATAAANPAAEAPLHMAEVPVARPEAARPRSNIAPVDINLADSITLQVLPGIGAKRASAILRYREKLGGFVSIAQVGETYGLPDSVFQKIQPSLTLGAVDVQQLSLNTATEAQLKAHPYIGWQLAKIIVAYRQQHGAYKSVDDLLKIHIIKKEWLEKVRPYVKAGE